MRQRRPTWSFANIGTFILLLAFILVGCGSPSPTSPTVTLTYWYTESPAEQPVIDPLIQQFEQENPSIKIHAEYQPFHQAQSAFTTPEVGNIPDILRSDIGWITQFASQGYLLPIDSYVSQSDLSDYQTVPLSYDKYQGHLYGLPQVTDVLALLYNRDEFNKAGITAPPATMDNFEANAKQIVQSKAATYGFETNGMSYYVLPFLMAFGGGMLDQQKHILVNNQGSITGLKFLLNLQDVDKVMPTKVVFSTGPNNMAVNDFKSGKTAMIFDGPWDVSNILTGSAFTGNPRNLGIAAVPMGSTGQIGSPLGGQSYVISAHTAYRDAAYQFIKFMSSRDSQIAIAKANHTLPTRRSAAQDPSVSSDEVISTFQTIQKNTAISRPTILQGDLFDVFDKYILAALDGTENATDALNAVYNAWQKLLPSS